MDTGTAEPAPVAALTDVFQRAAPAMAGLSIYHAGLGISARGFQPCGALSIGVMVTPWCMTLVLLPGPETDWSAVPAGQEIDHALPCGTVRFVTARDDEAGAYRVCSLFSPMFDFADMAAACATADAALAEVLAERAPSPPPAPAPRSASSRSLSRRTLLRPFGT
jgi:[NiFe] hydrogenase assembly HybE family chaperone